MKPELVVPAGGGAQLEAAVTNGADAVYLGGRAFSLRAKAKNFSAEEIARGVEYAHAHGVRVYVTVNAFAHEEDLPEVAQFLETLEGIGPDALIIADAGVFAMAGRICPALPVHLSTQAGNLNHEAFRFWYDLGVRRIVAARECTLRDLASIRKSIPEDMEIECFVHGAMCMAYSGRCHMSAHLTGRDANRGSCTQSCRWSYTVVEEKRPGEYFPVEETEEGTMIFAADDLCMAGHLPELLQTGVDALKIEGRTKTATYVQKVTAVYRRAIDDYDKDAALYEKNVPAYLAALREGASRPFGTGFYLREGTSRGI
ncbi:MAG: U32 family peptidase [Lachnospiraceae bacterium]|nr:U32 family peptidase [Lachnospiraceae bacterium]